MKLAIKLSDYVYAVFPAEDAGALVPAFRNAALYEKPWTGDGAWKPIENEMEFRFIEDDSLQPKPAPIEHANKELAAMRGYWSNTLAENSKLTAKVKELEDKLAAIGSAVA